MRETASTNAPDGTEGRRERGGDPPHPGGPRGLPRISLLWLARWALLAGWAALAAAGCAGEPEGSTPGASERPASDAVPNSGGNAARPGTVSAGAAQEGFRLDSTTLRIGGVEVTVEIADEPSERKRGLMHRDSLPSDHGMLFVYPEEGVRSFWMRDTSIPLSIAFIDRRGHIVDIQQMTPHSDRFHESPGPVLYALEMPRGWFARHGVKVGDRVSF